jgi:hypothetical protein
MSLRSEQLRKHARELTRNMFVDDDGENLKLSLGLAQTCIALARTEEWLDGEVAPVEEAPPSQVLPIGK